MLTIDEAALAAVQPELADGEVVLWAGRPNPRIHLHKHDGFLIPFGLIWGGLAGFIAWVAASAWLSQLNGATSPLPVVIVTSAFASMGQYLIWGRFLYAKRMKLRTHYAVTNQRVLAVQGFARRRMASAYIDKIHTVGLEEGPNQSGTLRFTDTPPNWGIFSADNQWQGWNIMSIGTIPVFVDIDELKHVYRLVLQLRAQSQSPLVGA
ncbi:PH domain-containing protein [Paludibaculum fermentans]|uniref:PH domain-containing protein n=1 Tax=Paludibaculum fermentans TaxID=1473598 RepID=A0A7S7NU36_PALFE|nr:PH domain-containing protein [Paludibaculum fermentans]QOY89852.1 PH domain-containing protein [Paludibaculum fermentans]